MEAAELSGLVAGDHAGSLQEPDVPGDPAVRKDLLRDCRDYVVGRVCEVVSAALNSIADELTEGALRSGRRNEQQAMMDAVSLVRLHRGELETRFRLAFTDCFERRLQGERNASGGSGADAEPPLGELSLVEESVINGKLTVDRLVHRTRSRLDPDEVLGMRARLAALLERDWFDEARHPAAPEAVFEALKLAVAELAPAADVQEALLDAFEPHVSANLNQVYSNVNERLRARRVLPKIRRRVQLGRAGESPRAAARAGAAPESPAHPAAAHGATRDDTGFPPLDALSGGFADGFPDDLHGRPAGVDPAVLFRRAVQQMGHGVPSARASVARLLTDPDSFGVADLPMPMVQEPLLASLTRMQRADQDLSQAGAGTRVFEQVNDQARDQGSALDQLTVEIVSMVFDFIYADARLPEQIKHQLMRLQVVAVKAALIDRSFFARRQHPMRRLIDRITELASDPDIDLASGSPMMGDLTQLVGWILLTFDQDLATFNEALARLEGLVKAEQERRAAHLADIQRDAERHDALEDEQRKAHGLLMQRLEEGTPMFVKVFLLDWWTQVLAAATLAADPPAMRAADAMQIAEALIWSVNPKIADEIPRLAGLLPKLIGGLTRGVQTIDFPEDERKRFFDELLSTHTELIASAKAAFSQRTAVFNATAKVRMRGDGEIQFRAARSPDGQPVPTPVPPEDPAQARARMALAQEVNRGDRIEIDDEHGVQRYKLAWISPSRKLYVLSRFPDDARQIDSVSLADLFECGKARVIERRSTVDGAMAVIVANQGLMPSSATSSAASEFAAAARVTADVTSAPVGGGPSATALR